MKTNYSEIGKRSCQDWSELDISKNRPDRIRQILTMEENEQVNRCQNQRNGRSSRCAGAPNLRTRMTLNTGLSTASNTVLFMSNSGLPTTGSGLTRSAAHDVHAIADRENLNQNHR